MRPEESRKARKKSTTKRLQSAPTGAGPHKKKKLETVAKFYLLQGQTLQEVHQIQIHQIWKTQGRILREIQEDPQAEDTHCLIQYQTHHLIQYQTHQKPEPLRSPKWEPPNWLWRMYPCIRGRSHSVFHVIYVISELLWHKPNHQGIKSRGTRICRWWHLRKNCEETLHRSKDVIRKSITRMSILVLG